MRGLRDRLEAGLRVLVPHAKLNGHTSERLANTLNMTLPGFRGESLILFLDRMGIYLSSGSACKSGNPDPSHVLMALGLTEDQAHCAIRLTLGIGTAEEDIDYALECFAEVIGDEGSGVRFVACR